MGEATKNVFRYEILISVLKIFGEVTALTMSNQI